MSSVDRAVAVLGYLLLICLMGTWGLLAYGWTGALIAAVITAVVFGYLRWRLLRKGPFV